MFKFQKKQKTKKKQQQTKTKTKQNKIKKNKTQNINPRTSKTSNGRTMLLVECAICGTKKSRFVKKQEAKVFLCNIGIKTPLSKIPILGDVLL